MARFFRIVLLLAVAALAGVILWPARPVGITGAPEQADAFEKKVLSLEQAVRMRARLTVLVSEAELNAYLARAVNTTRESAQDAAMAMQISDLNMDVTPSVITTVLIAGWGPLRVSYEIVGTPEIKADGFSMNVKSARLGHLPLPGMLRDRLAARVRSVFAQLEREEHTLHRLAELELQDEHIRLQTL
jgi:hypothetical protein